jgi:uncharacterized membrane protein YczE
MTQTSETKKDLSVNWYRFLYVAFVLFSTYFLFVSKDLSSAVSNLGIALIFDPFDQKMSWAKRPAWQRAWLLIHVSLVLVGFGFMIFSK